MLNEIRNLDTPTSPQNHLKGIVSGKITNLIGQSLLRMAKNVLKRGGKVFGKIYVTRRDIQLVDRARHLLSFLLPPLSSLVADQYCERAQQNYERAP